MYPTATTASFRRTARLTLAFSIAGFKAKDQRSVLGFLWSLLNPLLLSIVLFLVFRKSLALGRSGPDYFLDIFAGAVVWNFFVMATTIGAASLLQRAELIKNISFPIEVPVYGDIGALFLQYQLELLALFGAVLALGARPSWTLLLLPLVMLGQLALVVGIALVLACLSLVARDLQHVWSLFTRVFFFATPVFYPLTVAPAELRPWLAWNPVAGAMDATRALCRGGMPRSIDLISPVVIGLIAFGLGLFIFRRAAPDVVEKA